MSTNPRGRPRSDASRQAILDAAFAVLATRGYEGMTMEAVAAHAGVAKTTIYRWWPSKAELAVDAFMRNTAPALALAETGHARDDFSAQIRELATLLRDGRGTVLAAMLGGARTDEVLAKALGERWLEPRRQWGLERMMRAVAAGQVRPGVQPFAALGILYGPLYAPLLFGQGPPSPAMLEAHLAIALPAIFTTVGEPEPAPQPPAG